MTTLGMILFTAFAVFGAAILGWMLRHKMLGGQFDRAGPAGAVPSQHHAESTSAGAAGAGAVSGTTAPFGLAETDDASSASQSVSAPAESARLTESTRNGGNVADAHATAAEAAVPEQQPASAAGTAPRAAAAPSSEPAPTEAKGPAVPIAEEAAERARSTDAENARPAEPVRKNGNAAGAAAASRSAATDTGPAAAKASAPEPEPTPSPKPKAASAPAADAVAGDDTKGARLSVLADAGRALQSLKGDSDGSDDGISADEAEAMRLIESGEFVADDSNRPGSLLSAPSEGDKDDLKQISGVGPKLEEVLNGLGVFYFRQIADLSPQDIAWIDSKLKFRGRIVRDRWVDQARRLT